MLRKLIPALFLAAAPAAAQDAAQISQMIAGSGLSATEDVLVASGRTDATTQFAIGGIRFLRAIEKTLQTRWRLGINAARTELPVLRLPVPPNATPDRFEPGDIEALFATLIGDLIAARAPLEAIGDADAVDLPIRITDLWFDVNNNGIRDEGEGVTEIGGMALTGRAVRVIDTPTIRFDTADAAWLAAYTHFLSGFAELVLAFEPTDQIARVAEASKAMDALAGDSQYQNAYDMMFGQQVDRAAMIYFALQRQPDPAHTRATREHLLRMIALNRVFWARVGTETDNRGEWIPNDTQDQALGMTVPEGTGTRWQAVLDDAEAMLNGTKLIPHWRLRGGAGINLRRLLEDPVPVDLAEWVHGIGLLPYAEEGQRVTPDSWLDFERLVRGDGLMFVVFLN